MGALAVRNFTRQSLSLTQFENATRMIAPAWEMSLAFVGTTRATRINRQLRKKTYTPNVLSYALSKHHGEIVICVVQARKEAHSIGISLHSHLLFLFIHGLLHLEGYRHGTTMEQCEQDYFFRLTGKTSIPK